MLTLLSGLLALWLARVELFLQIAERLIRQALLFPQGFCQAFHGLFARRLTLLALTLCDLHVFHHLTELFERFLRFGHAALFHELLDAIHHLLQIVLAHLHHVLVLRHLLIRIVLLVLLRLAGQLTQIIVSRFTQFLHQFGDFLI